MIHASELRRDLVLIGGGHAHVLALRMLAMKPVEGLRITLVSPDSHTPYSGMLPGLIAGHYSFEQTHIDLARLCQWAGARFVPAAVSALDSSSQYLSLPDRPALGYDVVSIDIGSQPELDSVPGARLHTTPVKPVSGLWRRWQDTCQRVNERQVGNDYRIAVVGGGAGSVELALAMSRRLAGKPLHVDLWCGASAILQDYNARARRSVMMALQRNGIRVHLNARVAVVESNTLELSSGERAAFDELFWCTGAAAAPWVAASGLATDKQGFLRVRDTLQAVGDDRVFGAGDIATQDNHPRPKAGVYAVRQAPVLAQNLRAVLLGKPLRQHRPQERFLSLISLGEKQAVADKGPFSATGAWVWRWKDKIDRAFITRFQNLPASMPASTWGRLPDSETSSSQPVCGGCGAKVGADALAKALSRLSLEYPRYCNGTGDDAAIVPVPVGATVIQSLDVLRQIVSDPWQMGRVAANHALSDLYASGARPVSALAAVTLPFASSELLQRDLEQVLAGALHEFSAVGCQLNGGHSMQGSEMGLGFVVNGVAISEEGTLLGKLGASAGDALVLTKPLGTGVLFAGHMQLHANGRDIATAVEMMQTSNAVAAELALAHGASACTDITGFGLAGHLLEMLSGDLGARLELERLPALPGALELLRSDVLSTMHAANRRSAVGSVESPQLVDEARLQLLFDPQTSGGLLIAVPAQRASSLCEALRQNGYSSAGVIGEVTTLMPGATLSVEVG